MARSKQSLEGFESSLAKLENLIAWIPNRPQNYCMNVGEFDTLMHYLHMVWAKFADREADLAAAHEKVWTELGLPERRLWHDETRRADRISHDRSDTTQILEYVRRINENLGLKVSTEWTW